jgi:hypothetical protein
LILGRGKSYLFSPKRPGLLRFYLSLVSDGWVPVIFFPEAERSRREAAHTSPSGAGVKKALCSISVSPIILQAW